MEVDLVLPCQHGRSWGSSLYIADISKHSSILLASYADDKVIPGTHGNHTEASSFIQEHPFLLKTWF